MHSDLPWWDGQGKVNIIEIAGLEGTGKRDEEIQEEIYSTLQKCKVNSFVLLLSAENKFTKSVQTMLQTYMDMLD